VVDWTNKVLFLLEFKLTSDQRRDYRVRGYSQARAQHDILIRSLEKVAGEAEGENGGWKIKLIIFGGGHKWISECPDLQRQSYRTSSLGVKEKCDLERFGL
jgi:hypothetical protein